MKQVMTERLNHEAGEPDAEQYLTKRIYAALQLDYLSERHDAVRALIEREVAKARLDELKCSTIPGDFYWNKDDVTMTVDERMNYLSNKIESYPQP